MKSIRQSCLAVYGLLRTCHTFTRRHSRFEQAEELDRLKTWHAEKQRMHAVVATQISEQDSRRESSIDQVSAASSNIVHPHQTDVGHRLSPFRRTSRGSSPVLLLNDLPTRQQTLDAHPSINHPMPTTPTPAALQADSADVVMSTPLSEHRTDPTALTKSFVRGDSLPNLAVTPDFKLFRNDFMLYYDYDSISLSTPEERKVRPEYGWWKRKVSVRHDRRLAK